MKSMQRVAYKQVAVNSTTPRSAASATRRRTIHSSRKYAARYEEGRRRTKAEIKRSLSWVGMWTRRNANRKQSIYTLLSALYRTTKRQSLKTKDRSETHSNCEWWTCSRPMHSDPRLRTPTLPVTFGHPPCLTKLIIMNMRVCVCIHYIARKCFTTQYRLLNSFCSCRHLWCHSLFVIISRRRRSWRHRPKWPASKTTFPTLEIIISA